MLSDALTGAAALFTGEVGDAVAAAVPIALPIIAALVGWRLFKRFARG